MDNHPTAEDFERFLQAHPRPSDAECNARIVRHLLHNCEVCREALRGLRRGSSLLNRLLDVPLPGAQPGGSSRAYNYEWAFARTERVLAVALAQGGPSAKLPEKLSELNRLPEGEQIRRVERGGRYADPELIETLIERSHAARYQSPKKMLHLGRLAYLAAKACPAEDGAGGLADLQAQAGGAYGNAQRVCGQLREADETLALAWARCEQGGVSPKVRGLLLSQISSLRTFQRRLEEAVQLAQAAEEIFRELGDTQALARAVVQRAIALTYSGDNEPAAEILQGVIPILDREEDPQLFLAAHHNLARCYIDLGRPDEAVSLFVESRPLYQQCRDPLILLRASWQEGQLLREIGHLESAESALLRSRDGMIDHGLAYEAAMVGLDLADVYANLGRKEDLRRMITEAMPILRSMQAGREVLASLLRLRQAAEMD